MILLSADSVSGTLSNTSLHLLHVPVKSEASSPCTSLRVSSGWQAGSRERRPRGGNGNRVTVWVAEWKAISIPCQKGALTAVTHARASGGIFFSALKWKVFAELSSHDLFSPVSLKKGDRTTTPHEHTHAHTNISGQRVCDSETPLEQLKIQYLTPGEVEARIWSTTDVLTAGDCAGNLHPDIDSDLYLQLAARTEAITKRGCLHGRAVPVRNYTPPSCVPSVLHCF